ncbi:MAG: tRNA (adenosine(37)-N6)-threonylcarbamoyltransferase complex ATPase subunit type 1 TsaE [Alphaproteobacteria bacterium]|nr:tRNA (adenosine(37)-N6)-threonylcarbamoyltransferase complex ATPase subunit type 1 TsaE [Alphaproteobacteria bacterium]
MAVTELSLPETALANLAKSLIDNIAKGDVILLQGELGAGKTALARVIIQQLCHVKIVPSPSFSLVQYYITMADKTNLLHVDFYRLSDSQESDALDVFADNQAIILIEWPERGMIPSQISAQDRIWQITIKDNADATMRDYIITTPARVRNWEFGRRS